jgi:hypothetical protein
VNIASRWHSLPLFSTDRNVSIMEVKHQDLTITMLMGILLNGKCGGKVSSYCQSNSSSTPISTSSFQIHIKFSLSLRINTSKPCSLLCSDFQTSYFFFVLPRTAEGLRFAELLVRVTLAVVATSSSSMPFFPFFAPRPARLATCSLKHNAENPSINTLH